MIGAHGVTSSAPGTSESAGSRSAGTLRRVRASQPLPVHPAVARLDSVADSPILPRSTARTLAVSIVPVAHEGDLLPTPTRAHHFFALTSFKISMSMSSSASIFLSFAFSALERPQPLGVHRLNLTESLAPGVDRLVAHSVLLATSDTAAVRLAQDLDHLLSENLFFFMASSVPRGPLSKSINWTENRPAGHPIRLSANCRADRTCVRCRY